MWGTADAHGLSLSLSAQPPFWILLPKHCKLLTEKMLWNCSNCACVSFMRYNTVFSNLLSALTCGDGFVFLCCSFAMCFCISIGFLMYQGCIIKLRAPFFYPFYFSILHRKAEWVTVQWQPLWAHCGSVWLFYMLSGSHLKNEEQSVLLLSA